MAQNEVIGSIAEEIHALTEAIGGDGGSGGGGGEGGGSGVMFVELTYLIETGEYRLVDVSYSDIAEAYESGQLVILRPVNGPFYYCNGIEYTEESPFAGDYLFRGLYIDSDTAVSDVFRVSADSSVSVVSDEFIGSEPLTPGAHFSTTDGWGTPEVFDEVLEAYNNGQVIRPYIEFNGIHDGIVLNANSNKVVFGAQWLDSTGSTYTVARWELAYDDSITGVISTIAATPLT